MSWLIADGHVHLHQAHSVEMTLSSALANFSMVERALSLDGPVARFLFLTESHGTTGFEQLAEMANRQQSTTSLSLERTREPATLWIADTNGQGFYVVAGRQIVTAERLEVLALGYRQPYPDGLPINKVLEELSNASCLRVLPWGAGKWLGRRGRIVEEIVRSPHPAPLFLGDNANRPWFWPLPDVFRAATALGIRNLPGSDPLPFPDQERKAGAFGFYLPGTVAENQPFASIHKLLSAPEARPQPYGRLENLFNFLNHQVTMQCGKQKADRPASRP